jgi:IS4 transposase
MAAKILSNLPTLCEETDVSESLISALYSKGVIDNEFKGFLVRFRSTRHALNIFSAYLNVSFCLLYSNHWM